MDLTGEQLLPASRGRVWAALNDPDTLKACIPGCESIALNDDGTMVARVIAKVGPVKAAFSGKVRFENVVAGESYTLVGEGQGGVAGFAKGAADVTLADAGGGATRMTYVVRAQIGGKLAQLGSRLIDSTAKSMAEQFFGSFAAIVAEAEAAGAVAAPEPAVQALVDAGMEPAAPVRRPPGLPLWAWIVAAGLLAGAVIGALR